MERYHELTQLLVDCAIACERCATACLEEDDVKMMAQCVKLDRDCADICTLAARLLQRESPLALQYLLLCEEACRTCADECSKHDNDHCAYCAQQCLACAQACHEHHQPIAQI